MSKLIRTDLDLLHHWIAPEPGDDHRKTRGGYKPPQIPERNRPQHAKEITKKLKKIVSGIKKTRKRMGVSPDRLFVLEFDSENHDLREGLDRFNISIVEEQEKKVNDKKTKYKYLVQCPSPKILDNFLEDIELYQNGSKEKKCLPKKMRENFFDGFLQAREVTSEERKGERLKEKGLPDQDEFYVDVQVWYDGKTENKQRVIWDIIRLISLNQGNHFSTAQVSNVVILRAEVNKRLLEKLLNCDLVAKVDLPPDSYQGSEAIFSDEIGTIKDVSPSSSTPLACVIDSGVISGHPLLRGWVVEERDFASDEDNPVDEMGHGTSVAGIVIYGDITRCLSNNNWIPIVAICSAKVVDSEGKWPDKKLRISQVEEAIRYFHQERGCRIFNLSLGDDKEVYQDGRQFPWAEKLDELARKLDIVIVISSGNRRKNLPLPENCNNPQDIHQFVFNEIVLNNQQRICNPATSSISITVGSVSRTEATYLTENEGVLHDALVVSPADGVSVFSRTGPGYLCKNNHQLKPEFCQYGGSAAIQRQPNRNVWVDDIALGEPTIQKEKNGRYIGACSGTSFACPHVAHEAAIAQRCLGESLGREPSANLIRAFLGANTKSLPVVESFCEDDNGNLDKKKYFNAVGFGILKHTVDPWSKNNTSWLIAEEEIEDNKLHFYKINLPKPYFETKGKRGIVIALAYDPPVRASRKEYLARTMTVEVIKGQTDQNIRLLKTKIEDNLSSNDTNSTKKCELEIFPSKNTHEWSTLQVRRRTWKRLNTPKIGSVDETMGPVIHLMVKCQKRFNSGENQKQKYALAIKFWHECDSLNLHESLLSRVRLKPQRVRVRS